MPNSKGKNGSAPRPRTAAQHAKYEAFAVAYVRLGNATAAYREVYKPKPTATDAGIYVSASRILAKVRLRVQELQRPAAESAQQLIADHIAQLQRLRELGVKYRQIGSALKAEDLIAHRLGLVKKDDETETDKTVTHINAPFDD